MIADWERDEPRRIESILAGLRRVVPSHLMDGGQFDFLGLAVAPDLPREE